MDVIKYKDKKKVPSKVRLMHISVGLWGFEKDEKDLYFWRQYFYRDILEIQYAIFMPRDETSIMIRGRVLVTNILI